MRETKTSSPGSPQSLFCFFFCYFVILFFVLFFCSIKFQWDNPVVLFNINDCSAKRNGLVAQNDEFACLGEIIQNYNGKSEDEKNPFVRNKSLSNCTKLFWSWKIRSSESWLHFMFRYTFSNKKTFSMENNLLRQTCNCQSRKKNKKVK